MWQSGRNTSPETARMSIGSAAACRRINIRYPAKQCPARIFPEPRTVIHLTKVKRTTIYALSNTTKAYLLIAGYAKFRVMKPKHFTACSRYTAPIRCRLNRRLQIRKRKREKERIEENTNLPQNMLFRICEYVKYPLCG